MSALLLGASAAHGVCQVAAVTRISSDPNPPNLRGQIVYTPAPAWGANVNREGLVERLSDVLLFDNGAAPNCFAAGNVLSVT